MKRAQGKGVAGVTNGLPGLLLDLFERIMDAAKPFILNT
jgi:hypothetical protein